MRGLSRHRHPEPVALRGHRAPVREDRDRHHDGDGEPLQHGERGEVALGRQRAVVHRADGLVHDRRVLPVEPARVGVDARVVERRLERKIRRGGHPPRPVGHHQRKAERPHLRAQPQQRFGLGAGARIVEPAEDARVEAAGGGGVGLEMAEDQQAASETQPGEQGHEHHRERWARGAAAGP